MRAASRAPRCATRRWRSPRTSWKPRPKTSSSIDGVISVRGTPTRSVAFADVAHVAYLETSRLPEGIGVGLEATATYKAPPFSWSNACHICTVEIDRDTGVVKILRYVVSEDCGVMINPMIVEGQIAGGVVQGIGGALYEAADLRRRRQPAHDDVHGLSAADRGRSARHRVRAHRDAVGDAGRPQGDGRRRGDRLAARGLQRGRRRARARRRARRPHPAVRPTPSSRRCA